MCPLKCFERPVATFLIQRRYVIKCNHHISTQLHLYLDRLFRREKHHIAGFWILKSHSVFSNLPDVCQREHLETTRIRKNWALPLAKSMHAAQGSNNLLTGLQVKVVGII